MRTVVLLLIATWRCRKISPPPSLMPKDCRRKAVPCNGMQPCLGNSARRRRDTPVGRLLISGSPSVGRRRIMWTPTTGKAVTSAEATLSPSVVESDDRKCLEPLQHQRSTEALPSIGWHSPTQILHQPTEPATFLVTLRLPPADRLLPPAQSTAQRRTYRLPTTPLLMAPLQRHVRIVLLRPHHFGVVTPRASPFATRAVCS